MRRYPTLTAVVCGYSTWLISVAAPQQAQSQRASPPADQHVPERGPSRLTSLDIAWWNDLFADAPPADDRGFTNDFFVAAGFGLTDSRQLRFAAFHRMLTERSELGGQRRWDYGTLTASYVHSGTRMHWNWQTRNTVGVALAGNLGGRAIQNWWHTSTGTGATLDGGLPYLYDGDRRAGLLVGTGGTVAVTLGNLSLSANIDNQWALGGTGLTRFDAGAALSLRIP